MNPQIKYKHLVFNLRKSAISADRQEFIDPQITQINADGDGNESTDKIQTFSL